jgi:hypothetical protein
VKYFDGARGELRFEEVERIEVGDEIFASQTSRDMGHHRSLSVWHGKASRRPMILLGIVEKLSRTRGASAVAGAGR